MNDKHAARLVTITGGTIGLCIVGDSLLYSILPLEAENLGISLPLVGVLLSANRLIRMISNTWASVIFERFGPYSPFLIATIISLISTILYGLGWGFVTFLFARILWGISWSGLRQGGYQAIWIGTDSIKGRLTGLLWGLIRLGSAASVLVGGYLYDRYGYDITITAIIAITVLSIPVAASIRWPKQDHLNTEPAPSGKPAKFAAKFQKNWGNVTLILRQPRHRWLILAGFVNYLLSSTILATTSIFLANRFGSSIQESGTELVALGIGVGTVTGLLHGTRWITDLGLGPMVGILSDRWGQTSTAISLSCLYLLLLVGVMVASPIVAVLGLGLVLICDGCLHITLAAAASGAARETERPHLFAGFYSTANDMGSAIGPLLAFSVAFSIGLLSMYMSLAVALLLILWRYWRLQITTPFRP